MKNPLTTKRWNPYIVGILIGILSWITFFWMHKALGTSTTFAKAAGALTGVVAPEHVAENPYYQKYFNPEKGKVMFDWQFFLDIAMLLGAFMGARLSGSHFREYVPDLWKSRFGSSRTVRYAGAFLGGIFLLYGARMAGGCTSGHGISGGLQLAVGSWAFFMAMFIAATATAFILFGIKGRDYV